MGSRPADQLPTIGRMVWADGDGCKSATKTIGIIRCDPDDQLGDRVIRHVEPETCFLTA